MNRKVAGEEFSVMHKVRNRSLFLWLLLAACVTPPAVAHRHVEEWLSQVQPDSLEQADPGPQSVTPTDAGTEVAQGEVVPETTEPTASPDAPATQPAPAPAGSAPAELAPSFTLPEALPEGTVLTIEGSPSMGVITRSLLQRFEQTYSGTSVTLIEQSADPALQNLVAGETDLVAIGRPLTPEERAQGLAAVSVSREKIAVIVGQDNPFQGDVDSTTFVQIFRGEITNWSQLGGPDLPIRLVDRPVTSDTRRALGDYTLFGGDLTTGGNVMQVPNDSTAEVVDALGDNGISYAIASQVLNQDNVRVLSMHNTLPDDPRYPYSQPRNFVYAQATTLPARVEAFLAFATNPAGQEAVAQAKAAEAADVAPAELPDRVTAMRPNGQGFVTGDRTGNLNFWNADGTTAGEPVSAHTGPVTALAFSPDGQRIISGGADGTLRFWDAVGTPVGEPINGGNGPITSLVIQPDGSFVSASADGTLQRWDNTGNPVGEPIRGHEDTVRDLALTPDGQTLVSASQDGTIRQWNLADGTPQGNPIVSNQGAVNALAIQPDGSLISGGVDGTVKRWSAAGEPIGEPIQVFSGAEPITALAVNSANGRIVAGNEMGSLQFLTDEGVPDGPPITDVGGSVDDLTFTPDGERLVVSAGETPQIRDNAGQLVASMPADNLGWMEGLESLNLPPELLNAWQQIRQLPPQALWILPIAILAILLWGVLRSLQEDEDAEDEVELDSATEFEEADFEDATPADFSPTTAPPLEVDEEPEPISREPLVGGDVSESPTDFSEPEGDRQPISGISPDEAAATLDPKLEKARKLLSEGADLVEAERPLDALEAFNRSIEAADLERLKAEAAGVTLVGAERVIARGLARRGSVLADLGRSEEALQSFDRALEMDADDIAAWIGKGNLMAEMGRFEEALFCFDKAIQMNPNLGTPWQGKGQVLQKLGREAEARTCFAKAQALGETISELPDLAAPVPPVVTTPPVNEAPSRRVPDSPDAPDVSADSRRVPDSPDALDVPEALGRGVTPAAAPTPVPDNDGGDVPAYLQAEIAALPSEPDRPSSQGKAAPPIPVPPVVSALENAEQQLIGDEVPASVKQGGADSSSIPDGQSSDADIAQSSSQRGRILPSDVTPPAAEDAGYTVMVSESRQPDSAVPTPSPETPKATVAKIARPATAVTPDEPTDTSDNAGQEGMPTVLAKAFEDIPDNHASDSVKPSSKKPEGQKVSPPGLPENPRLKNSSS